MMTELANRKILDDGTVICEQSAMVDLLYAGRDLSDIFCSNPQDAEEWIVAVRLEDSTDQGPKYTQSQQYQNINWYDYWFTPDEYKRIDLKEWCLSKCKNQDEIDRVLLEINEFEKRNMISIMKHLIYCVNVWRDNNITWGVGRGSSVSSFVLYLIGINRINPLKFNLDIGEWLK
jgi:DNA polymerase III alpha subunit